MNKKLITTLAGGALVLGGVGTTVAVQAAQGPSIMGTVQLPRGTSDLVGLAEVSQQYAVAAAQEALGTTGSPAEVELEVENGYLVWEVEFPGQEVVVDAGTGEVLFSEAEGSEGTENEDTEDDAGENEQGEDDVQ